MTAMVIGAAGSTASRATTAFEAMRILVVRVADAPGACERIAVDMPQVVLVLHMLRTDEREALGDRATAVGALLVDVDPELDDASFEVLVERTVHAAIQRKLVRDEAEANTRTAPPETSNDVDAGWDL